MRLPGWRHPQVLLFCLANAPLDLKVFHPLKVQTEAPSTKTGEEVALTENSRFAQGLG